MKNKTTKPTTAKKTNAPCKLEQRFNALNAFVTSLTNAVNAISEEQAVIDHRSKVGLWIAIVAFVVSVGHAILALTH